MPLEKRPAGPRPVWFLLLGTGLIATVLNFVVLPLWFGLALSLGSTDISPGAGVFATCTPDSLECTGPDYVMAALLILVLVGLAALAAKLGQMLARTGRNLRLFLALSAAALALMGIEAWIFIF